MTTSVQATVECAKAAARLLGTISSDRRAAAIRTAATAIEHARQRLLGANDKDLNAARAMVAGGEITASTFERLRLTSEKIDEMTQSMLAVADLPDPLGCVIQRTELDSKLVLDKVTVPLGLLAVIFEARPDAVTQISALALKSGNAVILKPGREVEQTAAELVNIIHGAYASSGLPNGAVSLVNGRAAVLTCSGCPNRSTWSFREDRSNWLNSCRQIHVFLCWVTRKECAISMSTQPPT